VLLSLSLIGIFLSVILLYFNARKYTSSIYLGGFFFFLSLYGLNQYVVMYSKSVFFVSIVFLNIAFLSYLIGPLLYWYVRSILTDNSRMKKRDFWHLLPAVIFLIASLPHMFTPYSHKVEIAAAIVHDLGFVKDYKGNVLYEVVPLAAIFISRPVLVLGYSFWSIGFFIRYLNRRRALTVFSQQYFMTKWLSVFLGFLSVLALNHLLLMVKMFAMESTGVFFTLNILQILSGTGLAGLLISPFFFPAILYGLPRLPESVPPSGPAKGLISAFRPEAKKIMPDFEPDYLSSIDKKAHSAMQELQPYLQPDCNLAYFSKLINLPAHHLACYFREVKKQSFNDFRNEWRIIHAKKLIKEGKANELTLEAIGLLSGFSSRTTFFTAFKKVEGTSPGAFAARVNG